MEISSQRPAYLFILPWSLHHLGGVNQVVENLALEMKRNNVVQPIVLIADWDATQPIWEVVHGINTVRWRIRSYHEDMGIKEKLAFFVWEAQFSLKFYRFCNEHKVVAINAHYPGGSAFSIARIIKRFSRNIRFILSFHGTDISNIASANDSVLTQWRTLLLDASTSGVVVCSNDLGRRLVDVVGSEISPVVIHNGLNTREFSSMAHESTSGSTERIILNVAKFEQQKGQDVLIKAFAEIACKCDDVKLVLVGSTDKALPSLRALCVSKSIEQRVEFHPDIPHKNVADFYKVATVFCLPSRKEAFGIVMLEAASFAVPVVASRIGGIPELVSDGINGFLVPPDNSSELARCIMLLLDDPVLAKEMGKCLSEHVHANFTWNIAYTSYINMLK